MDKLIDSKVKHKVVQHDKQWLRRITHGLRRIIGRYPAIIDDITFIRRSGAFDREYYLAQYPDVEASGIDALTHYVGQGATERRNPSAAFNTGYYLDRYPDVAASGMNPLRHYLEYGAIESRRTSAPCRISTATDPSDHEVIEASGLFDKAWYRGTYSGVASAGVDPIGHYLLQGADEGKNPSSSFDTSYYLKSYPDVAAAGINPLIHFIRYGRWELRNPSKSFNAAWYWLIRLAGQDAAAHPLSHYQSIEDDTDDEVRPSGNLGFDDSVYARTMAHKILMRLDVDTLTINRLGFALSRLGLWAEAEEALHRALSGKEGDAKGNARLARVLAMQKKWRQAADAWTQAIKIDGGQAAWFYYLAQAYEKMNDFGLAAEAYGHAIDRGPGQVTWHYLQGYMWERAGQRVPARSAYAQAIALDTSLGAKAFGVGVFHQARKYWPEAAEAYAQTLQVNPASAELHYRLGMALDRCYRWDKAEAAYRDAIALQPEMARWHYRIGFVLERQERFTEAANAYRASALLSSAHKPYWWYRCGCAFASAGEYAEACRSFLRTSERQIISGARDSSGAIDATGEQADWLNQYLRTYPTTRRWIEQLASSNISPLAHYRLGEACERRGDWSAAANAYADAVARSNPHQPDWYYRLGVVLLRAHRFADACEAFRNTRIIQSAYGLSEKWLRQSRRGIQLTTIYAEYRKTIAIKSRIILYESQTGTSVSGSGLAICRSLLTDPQFEDYIHVWVVDDPSRIPDSLKSYSNVLFAEHQSDLYLRYLASAEFLVNDTGFPYYFVRRRRQRYLNTWHGAALKTIGKQQRYKFLEHRRSQRNFLQATHLISPDPHTTQIMLDSYDLRNMADGHLAETGYPRVDLTLNASGCEQDSLRKMLGIVDGRPIVLYAPTWRGTLQALQSDITRTNKDLEFLSSHHDCNLIFRGHRFLERVVSEDQRFPCVVPSRQIDTNALLAIVDVLITDYSSLAFDFMATGRPILHYVYDLDSYQRERGLYFSMDRMPGAKCRTIEDVSAQLLDALNGIVPDRDHYRRTQSFFNKHDDGNATRRAINFFFHGVRDDVVPRSADGPNILVYAGSFEPGDVNTKIMELLEAMRHGGCHNTVAVSPALIDGYGGRMEKFLAVQKNNSIVARVASATMTREERWLRKWFEDRPETLEDKQIEIVRELFDREYLRTFGRSRFDVVVDAGGGDWFWSAILLLNKRELRKVVSLYRANPNGPLDDGDPLRRSSSRAYQFADSLICDDMELKRALDASHDGAGVPYEVVYCSNTPSRARVISEQLGQQ